MDKALFYRLSRMLTCIHVMAFGSAVNTMHRQHRVPVAQRSTNGTGVLQCCPVREAPQDNVCLRSSPEEGCWHCTVNPKTICVDEMI